MRVIVRVQRFYFLFCSKLPNSIQLFTEETETSEHRSIDVESNPQFLITELYGENTFRTSPYGNIALIALP